MRKGPDPGGKAEWRWPAGSARAALELPLRHGLRDLDVGEQHALRFVAVVAHRVLEAAFDQATDVVGAEVEQAERAAGEIVMRMVAVDGDRLELADVQVVG